MCSNNSSCNTQEDLMPEEEKLEINPDKVCPRCNVEKGEVVLRSKDVYCKSCLLQYLTHKFRAALGKSKLMRPQDKALVAFSASHSSMALLHLLRAGMQQSSHKRILFSVCVVFIDDGSISDLSVIERRRINAQVMCAMQSFGFDNHFTCLDAALDLSSLNLHSDINDLPTDQLVQGGELKRLFDSITTLSSKQYLLQTLRQKLLLEIASRLKCTKIFTAETQTDLATKIIANLALGKGAHIPLDVGFNDDRIPDVITLRPLRDFSSKEVIYYNMFNEITSVHVPSLATLADPLGSLQKAAETFVTDLQTNFPSTVSTVFKTADKLSLDLSNLNVASVCVLCKAPLDTRSDLASSSLGATKFSHHVSNATREELSHVTVTSDSTSRIEKSGDQSSVNLPESKINSEVSKENEEECSSLQDTLCYACQYVVKDMKNDREVGEDVLKKSLRELCQSSLEEQIKDYLL